MTHEDKALLQDFLDSVAEATNLMFHAQLQVGSEDMQAKMREMVDRLTTQGSLVKTIL